MADPKISDEAVRAFQVGASWYAMTSRQVRDGLRAALPHLRGMTVDAALRERMAEAAENALSWSDVVDAVLELVPVAAAPAPLVTVTDEMIKRGLDAYVAIWKDRYGPDAMEKELIHIMKHAVNTILSAALAVPARPPEPWPPAVKSTGANGMHYGDRVRCVRTGKFGMAGEFMPDGEVDVMWDDGTFETTKWRLIEPAPEPLLNPVTPPPAADPRLETIAAWAGFAPNRRYAALHSLLTEYAERLARLEAGAKQ